MTAPSTMVVARRAALQRRAPCPGLDLDPDPDPDPDPDLDPDPDPDLDLDLESPHAAEVLPPDSHHHRA
ncbi:MAG: hypothetical protein ACTHVK_02545 [Brachybacterium sp.]